MNEHVGKPNHYPSPEHKRKVINRLSRAIGHLNRVKQMVERQKKKYNWEFIFMGANIDAVKTGMGMGFARERSVNYMNDSRGVKLQYETLKKVVGSYVENNVIDEQVLEGELGEVL